MSCQLGLSGILEEAYLAMVDEMWLPDYHASYKVDAVDYD